jgi:hypothetical protein
MPVTVLLSTRTPQSTDSDDENSIRTSAICGKAGHPSGTIFACRLKLADESCVSFIGIYAEDFQAAIHSESFSGAASMRGNLKSTKS